MPGLAIGWEYLTGYAVATDPSSRDHAEWPPHPARVFMAMAAAWFETGENAAEGEALRWLETLGDPELRLPPRERVVERSPVTVYVPVNDKSDAHNQPDKKKKATIYPHLGSVSIGRNRQPRTFPRVHVGDARCYMHWPEAESVEEHREALDCLCSKVTRIGHSSSLVRMWVADAGDLADSDVERLIRDDQLADRQARAISNGMLSMLVERFGENERQRHAALSDQIDALKADRKAVKGKGSKERKAAIDGEIKLIEEQREAVAPRPPIRPTIGLWSGYRRVDAVAAKSGVVETHFDTDVLILTQVAGPTLPVVSALTVTSALRGAVMKHSGIQPAPPWVSGHESDGSKCENDAGHLGYIPLPFVGHEHADGHILGVGLVFPRSVNRPDRGRVLGPLLLDNDNQPRQVELQLGQLGVLTLKKRHGSESRGALQPETWTAHPNGAKTWASVTPVVLDRFPKTDRMKDRVGWTDEVAVLMAESCRRIGLPNPVDIAIDTTCWHRGSPRAVGKRRPLRGHAGSDSRDASLGNGFPFYQAKNAQAPRPQVHVWLEFADPVVGPMLLGAGRYQGYGLCKPVNGSKEEG